MPLGLHRLMQAMNALGTLWILALMVLINSDVIGRNLFSAPILGVPEMTSLSIVGIVFLQLADTLRCGRFTRADILLDSLKRRRPAAADLLQAVFHAIGALLMAAILWAAWAPLVDSVRIFEYVGAVGSFPIRLITLLGLATTMICFALLASADLQRLFRRRHHE